MYSLNDIESTIKNNLYQNEQLYIIFLTIVVVLSIFPIVTLIIVFFVLFNLIQLDIYIYIYIAIFRFI